MDDREERTPYDDLVGRVRASRLPRSSRLAAITRALTRRELIPQCSWCGRYRVGSEWGPFPEAERFAAALRLRTHTICPDCAAELRRSGSSH